MAKSLLRNSSFQARNYRPSDIIVASAKAYVHALNKLAWHKQQHTVTEPKGI